MNTVTTKIANGIDLATSKDIPNAGDFWIDPKTNNGKIGDGKTAMFELPWITLGVDLSTEFPRKYKISDKVMFKNYVFPTLVDNFYNTSVSELLLCFKIVISGEVMAETAKGIGALIKLSKYSLNTGKLTIKEGQ